MDIKQQTKNVAAQGRFGDSMLLHVNPAEVKGLASQVPLTINPDTGQPEAFLPFLAPIVGGMLGSSLLAGTGGILAGKTLLASAIGSGLAQTAVTGDIKKGLLAGLTGYGVGAALQGAGAAASGAAEATQAASEAATSAATGLTGDAATQAVSGSLAETAAQQAATQGAAANLPYNIAPIAGVEGAVQPTMFQNLKSAFTAPGTIDPTTGAIVEGSQGFNLGSGASNLASGLMQPSAFVPAGVGMGTTAVIESQEEFERQMAQLAEDDEERKRRMYEMYPEQIPMKEGGKTGYAIGRLIRDDIDYLKDYDIDYGNIGGFTTPPRRIPRPIGSGFMPGFMPEYNYFSGINPSATALGFNPLGTSPQNYNRPTNRFRGIQPMPPRGGFRNEGGFGFTPPPPPMFGGYGNPFMQSPSYQGFYGVPQMQQMLNPYARFTQQPIPYQPYVPYVPPVETPPDDGGGTGGGAGDGTGAGTGGIGIPPIGLPPGDIGGGRKGAVKNIPPSAPEDDFTVGTLGGSGYGRFPLGTAGPEYIYDDSGNPVMEPPSIGGPVKPPLVKPPYVGGGLPDKQPSILPDPITPPPTITIPIEGGADVTIPDYSRPQPPAIMPPRIEPPMRRPEPPMSIGGPGGGNMTGREELELANTTVGDMMARPPADLFIQNVENKGPESLSDRYGVRPLLTNIQSPINSNDSDRFLSDRVAIPAPIAPPVQSVITPQPIGQAPKPVQAPVDMTPVQLPNLATGQLETVNIGNYNLPSGPTAPTAPAPGARQIPTGPAMGGINAIPTPAAPANNPPQMSIGGPGGGRGGIFGAPMFAGGGDTSKELPNEGLKALYASGEKGKEAVEAMGYQEGGATDMMQDPVTQNVIMFILGETDDENAINAFVEKYGAEQFMFLRDKILKQAAGNPDAQTEGLIEGMGNSGMADDLPMNIGDKPIAAVSQDEYIVPADVVSMLGDGSSDAGSKRLDGMLDRVRMAKTGGKTQAPPLNPNKVLPA